MTRETGLWMPIYWADYIYDTQHLTTEQHGAYLLLISAYWRRGGALPNDDKFLAQVARMTPKKWSKTKTVVRLFFELSGDVLIHKRLEKEILKSNSRLASARTAGVASGVARRQPTTTTTTEEGEEEERTPNGVPKKPEMPPTLKFLVEAANKPKGNSDGSRPGARCPADLKITDQDREYARSKGTDGGELWPEYISHFTNGEGRNKTAASWHGGNSPWGRWCRNDAKWAAERMANRPNTGGVVSAVSELMAQDE